MREVIARIVDGSDFDEFKQLYGATLVCGFARLHGMPIGIVANNGVLFGESAQKGAHFIQLVLKRRIPLLFLQNITGFMVGRQVETQALLRMEQKWSLRWRLAGCQRSALVIGNSYGAGNYGMVGLRSRLSVYVAERKVAVMGGEQAAGVLAEVRRGQMEASGAPGRKTRNVFKRPIIDQFDAQASAYWRVRKIVDTELSRQKISACAGARICSDYEPSRTGRFGVFRM